MQWQPNFITNLETSGNLSKCFVCIGSIFQIGYILYCNERKQESLWSFIIFATKPEVIFLLWQILKWHIMPFENVRKNPICYGKLKGKGVDETFIYQLALTKAKSINVTRRSSNGKKNPIANGKKMPFQVLP